MENLRCGIEIHQRLATKNKLFCACRPTADEGEAGAKITRRLAAVAGELGTTDPAAQFEADRNREYEYLLSDESSCLVEADEEPPFELNKEALQIVLQVSKALNSRIMDEIHVMRKTVVDGSSVSGFQRTALVAVEGSIDTSFGKVGIQTVCLEEESSGIVGTKSGRATYRLDRLGIPLVEIATKPGIKSGAQAKEAAMKIGMLLRSTGKVQRGIGSIRQDVNISVDGGARVEIKGAQELDLIEALVENEAKRQKALNELAKKAPKTGKEKIQFYDVSEIFSKASGDGFIERAIARGERAIATKLEGFAGLLGKDLLPNHRFGTELSQYAKASAGVGGIIHSDEQLAENYGLEKTAAQEIARKLGCKKADAWVASIASEENAKMALNAVVARASKTSEGAQKETRRAVADRTEYMRPLPGSARMYPETDVPPVAIERGTVESIGLPEALEDRVLRYREMGLAQAVAANIAKDHAGAFETFAKTGADPVFVAATLLETFTALRRRGANIEEIGQGAMAGFFEAYKNRKFTKAAAPVILERMANSEKLESVLDAGLGMLDQKKIRALVDGYRKKNPAALTKELFGIIIRDHRLTVDAGDLRAVLEKY